MGDIGSNIYVPCSLTEMYNIPVSEHGLRCHVLVGHSAVLEAMMR
jgi:hypothetical protein